MKHNVYSLFVGCCLLVAAPALQAQQGALDPTFNGTGYVIDPVNSLDVGQKILVQEDQKVLLFGSSFDAQYVASAHAFRYNPDGSPDTDFGTDGAFTYLIGQEANIYSAALTANGKIIMVGAMYQSSVSVLLVIQLNADGTLDEGFGTGGVVTQAVGVVPENGEDIAYDVAIDANGNILVCGLSFDADYIRRPIVVRFTAAGALDVAFGTAGVAGIPAGIGSSSFKGIVVQPDGRIVASGSFGSGLLWNELLLVRFNADGSLDESFGDQGVVKYNYGNVDDRGEDLVLTPDGSILVAGFTVTQSYNYSALLMKFMQDGSVDVNFGENGAVMEDMDNYDHAWELSLLADGKIVIAGTSGQGPPNGFDMAVWKYLPDGSRDITFGTGGFSSPVIPNRYAMIYAMDVQADGAILVGGQARTTANVNHFLLARLQNNITSSVAEVTDAQAFAFPNPARAGTVVNVDLHAVKDLQGIALYTADGRLVRTYSGLQRATGGSMLALPTELAPGVYHIAVQYTGGRSTTSLVITD